MKPDEDNLPCVPSSDPVDGKRRTPVRQFARIWVAHGMRFPTHTQYWTLPPDEAKRRVLCDYCGLPVIRAVKASFDGTYPKDETKTILLSGDRAHWWTRHPAVGQPPIHYAPKHNCPPGTYERKQREIRSRDRNA